MLDLISEAADTNARRAPLRFIRLHTLLQAQPGWGEAKTTVVIDRMLRCAGLPADTPRSALTIGWLLDNRVPGRLEAFADALAQRQVPWPGFPYAPIPARLSWT